MLSVPPQAAAVEPGLDRVVAHHLPVFDPDDIIEWSCFGVGFGWRSRTCRVADRRSGYGPAAGWGGTEAP